MRLFERLREELEERPSDPFCTFFRASGFRHYSNAEISAEVGSFTALLLQERVSKGSIVAVVLESRFELFPIFIACVTSGIIPTVLPPASPKQRPAKYKEELDKLLQRLAPSLVVVSDATSSYISESGATTYNVDGGGVRRSEKKGSQKNHVLPDTAFIQQSSGTLALKKSAEISHSAVIHQLQNYGKRLTLRQSDSVVSWLPYYHDMGLFTGFLLPTFSRIPFVWIDPFEWVMRPWIFLREDRQNLAKRGFEKRS